MADTKATVTTASNNNSSSTTTSKSKRSKIVSEESDDLEESLMQEFNIRLKTCMDEPSTDPLLAAAADASPLLHADANSKEQSHTETNSSTNKSPPPPIITTTTTNATLSIDDTSEQYLYENVEIIKTNGKTEFNLTDSSIETENNSNSQCSIVDFIQIERENCILENGLKTDEKQIENNENLGSEFHQPTSKLVLDLQIPITSFTEATDDVVSSPDLDNQDGRSSVKDRMLLSTDEASCLLFTQTVTSPMLTPSEENIDFLKGFQRESSQNTLSDTSPRSEQNDELGSEEIIYENVTGTVRYLEDVDIVKDIQECEELKQPQQTDKVLLDEDEGIDIDPTIPNNNDHELIMKVQRNSGLFDHVTDTSIFEYETNETNEEEVLIIPQHRQRSDSPPMVVDRKPLSAEDYPMIPSVKSLKSQYIKSANTENLKMSGKEKTDIAKLKSLDIMKQISKFEQNATSTAGMDAPTVVCNSTTMTETSTESSFHVETLETKSSTTSNQEKAVKKKKSKKSRHEKENISVLREVNLNGYNDDHFYNVNVKNLCRSFGDLTRIEDEPKSPTKINMIYSYQRTKSLNDVRGTDNGKSLENVFGSVSVKILRDRFNNSASNCPTPKPIRHICEKIEILKSSFSKFDALQKKNVLHVRSTDSSKATEKFNGNGNSADVSCCKSCGKVVFQMEQMKAEKCIWHKNCFRCQECNKQLTVDTYQSHEGTLYCKPHFKALFTPKAVEDNTPPKPRKHELIIRENQPLELPPDVVRASDKPDLGLEELQSLNVKERFHVFEHHADEENQLDRNHSGAALNVKRSASILSKLARFQAKGMDVGVSDDVLNGIPIEESSSSADEADDEARDNGEDVELVRAKRAQKEKPFHFTGMSDVKSKWESTSSSDQSRDERREERKQEIQSIRSRLFMGKQGKMKEAYQQAVLESESGVNVKRSASTTMAAEVADANAKSIKERFEKGDVQGEGEGGKGGGELEEDMEVFESGISKKSRSIFLELDANASKAAPLSPISPQRSATNSNIAKTRDAFVQRQISDDVVKSTKAPADDVTVETEAIQKNFKFFETYREPEKQRKQFRITPPREGQQLQENVQSELYRDPNVVRAEEAIVEDSVVAKQTHTATKMLSKFRQMEENGTKDQVPLGPKPLKCFTPPPNDLAPRRDSGSSEYSSSVGGSDEDDDDNDADCNDHLDNGRTAAADVALIEAQKAARAKQLRAKFERWEANEIRKEGAVNIVECGDGEEAGQVESTKSLRARFESLKETASETKSPRIKVNRFVDMTNCFEVCQGCKKRVYALEKISIHGCIYHRKCFKCMECNNILRMDSYSYNQGRLYCTPHFKRLFISKGNYDTAFGLEQHKEKWNTTMA